VVRFDQWSGLNGLLASNQSFSLKISGFADQVSLAKMVSPLYLFFLLAFFCALMVRSQLQKSLSTLDCTFDSTPSACGWNIRGPGSNSLYYNNPADSGNSYYYKWVVYSGSTPSYSTGPSAAHLGSKYVYSETSSPRVNGDTVALSASQYTFSSTLGELCTINFWYHMYGSTIDYLKFDVLDLSRSTSWSTSWENTGNQGDRWLEDSVDLSPGTYDIRFLTRRSTSYTGDVALDDIHFSAGCFPQRNISSHFFLSCFVDVPFLYCCVCLRS
jgi:hypothetical protein